MQGSRIKLDNSVVFPLFSQWDRWMDKKGRYVEVDQEWAEKEKGEEAEVLSNSIWLDQVGPAKEGKEDKIGKEEKEVGIPPLFPTVTSSPSSIRVTRPCFLRVFPYFCPPLTPSLFPRGVISFLHIEEQLKAAEEKEQLAEEMKMKVSCLRMSVNEEVF
jgi:hypothetical protein